MRFLFPVCLAVVAVVSGRTLGAAAPSQRSSWIDGSRCPEAASHFAGRGGIWRNKPVRPRKLTELPRADAFAAVYRLDERGCMVPVMYRDVRAVRP